MTGRTPEREPAATAAAGATDVADDDLEVTAADDVVEEVVDAVPDKDAVEAAIKALWVEFKDTADPRLRERVILHFPPLVKFGAGRVGLGLPPNNEQADLVSYGI